MLPRNRYVVDTGTQTRPIVEDDGLVLHWVCPVYIRRRGERSKYFIADVIAQTPIDAAARAAALGQLIVEALERQTHVRLGGVLYGDAYSFARLFHIPHGWNQHRTTKPQAEGRA